MVQRLCEKCVGALWEEEEENNGNVLGLCVNVCVLEQGGGVVLVNTATDAIVWRLYHNLTV